MNNDNSHHGQADDTLKEAFLEFQGSEEFRDYPLQVRTAFQRVITWLPPREASFPIATIDASFGRMLRDKAARERGYKFGNYALLMLKSIIKVAINAGTLYSNRVAQVPRLLPPRQQPTNSRRAIKPIRNGLIAVDHASKAENSNA
jgi:hypothetical protein